MEAEPREIPDNQDYIAHDVCTRTVSHRKWPVNTDKLSKQELDFALKLLQRPNPFYPHGYTLYAEW